MRGSGCDAPYDVFIVIVRSQDNDARGGRICASMRRIASTPSITGMRRSMRMTSGVVSTAFWTALTPSAASRHHGHAFLPLKHG
jgi:hypothetical protein